MANSAVVAKFGGTSVGSEEAFRHILAILKANKRINVVVASATSGTTNSLIELFQACREQNSKKTEKVDKKVE